MRPDQLAGALSQLQAGHCLRQRAVLDSPQGPRVSIGGRDYLAFASNDYLGLANHPALKAAMCEAIGRWGVGGGSSALVAGHFAIQEQAERALAEFVGCEAALLFGSGYAANLGVVGSLVGRGDAIFADKLNHASLNDACQLSRAEFKRFRHNDLAHLAQLLQNTPAQSRLIVVDAVYSMEGDEAPLAELLQLAERYDAWLYIDDAHGFGILGDGCGALALHALQHPRVVYMATLGKAAGVAGAFVAGSRQLIDWLVNAARTYIFTTAHPPAQAAAVLASLQLIRQESWRRRVLQQHVSALRTALAETSFRLCPSRMPIQAIIIGGNEAAVQVAGALQDLGILVPAIRPPTVPAGSARLRVSLSAAHSGQDVSQLAQALVRLLR
ncbi:8-amino-7-oxononanoate synthase [Vogesella fluminis]|uniref:8-amino-7-oxononanoate synthase n=1 Tax=Vogesella fluminis TaxID=1069161 RepID=A0ABQ3H8C6_9NEIS|nr:8-amino-7-oxononanoate synthase [Vogesella fluminis]GHD75833.1 8-amino-7-oxononanoate synthase [Vogesella fluminis]